MRVIWIAALLMSSTPMFVVAGDPVRTGDEREADELVTGVVVAQVLKLGDLKPSEKRNYLLAVSKSTGTPLEMIVLIDLEGVGTFERKPVPPAPKPDEPPSESDTINKRENGDWSPLLYTAVACIAVFFAGSALQFRRVGPKSQIVAKSPTKREREVVPERARTDSQSRLESIEDGDELENIATQLVHVLAQNPGLGTVSIQTNSLGLLLFDRCSPASRSTIDYIKACLERCASHKRHIRSLRSKLADGGHGVAEEAVRIALDKQRIALNSEQLGSNDQKGLLQYLLRLV